MTRESPLAPNYGVLRVQQSPIPPRYTHRNGEREKPTIAGYFGCRRSKRLFAGIIHIVELEDGRIQQAHFDYGFCDLPEGEYWGPIYGPWDEAQA